jgi:hypothetical protein
MSELTVARPAVRPWTAVGATALVALALFLLYVVFLDQGALLAPLLGDASRELNYLHEFTHDGRHLFGAQCH